MLSIVRAGRVDEACASRKENQYLVTPMEIRFGRLERRLDEELRECEEAKARIAQESLR